MSNPNHILPILDDLIECYQDKKMFKFLHIPIQSGSNEVLRKMNRYYNINDVFRIIEEFRKKIPEINIVTDIIIGFPGETDEDFQKTMDAIARIKPDLINISRFWPMPRTPAAHLKKIHDSITKKRSKLLKELLFKITIEKNKKRIGDEITALVDEKGWDFSRTWIARSSEYYPIIVPSQEKVLGEKIKIKIKSVTPQYLIGEIVK